MGWPHHIDHCLWNLDRSRLRVDRDADVILGRVLEFGILEDVLWAMRT